jgi:hypothetical protein
MDQKSKLILTLNEKSPENIRDSFRLYLGGDSNSHSLRHTPLKRTCLPVPSPKYLLGLQRYYSVVIFKPQNQTFSFSLN